MVVYGADGLTSRHQAYDLLAQCVRLHWGLETLPEIGRAPEGKPYFPGHSGREFNLSHSGPLALCALDRQPVGVDIQVVKVWRESLPRRVCSPEELAWLERQPQLWSSFSALWALKESRVKCTGRGLRERLSGIRVPIPRPGESLSSLDGMWFRLYEGDGWRGAACGFSPPPDKIRWLEGSQKIPPLQDGKILL